MTKRRPKRIGLTALIDAVFILLLFFMLSSTFIKQTAIELSSTHSLNSELDKQQEPQLIVLNNDDSVALFQTREENMDMALLLKNLDTEKTVIVLPKATTTVQSIVSALSFIESSGFKQVSLGQILD